MISKRTLAVGLVTSALTASCHAKTGGPAVEGEHARQLGCDHLSPATSRLTDPDPDVAQHELLVSSTLLARAAQVTNQDVPTPYELYVVFVKQDPRRPEEAVYILQGPPLPSMRRDYKVVHARAKEPLRVGDVGSSAVFSEATVDGEVIRSLELSWGRMTTGARWPDREDAIKAMKFRGATYTFDYLGDNVYGQGATTSPEPGTCAASIVDLGELLIRFANEPQPENRRLLRNELLRKSRALAERLNG